MNTSINLRLFASACEREKIQQKRLADDDITTTFQNVVDHLLLRYISYIAYLALLRPEGTERTSPHKHAYYNNCCYVVVLLNLWFVCMIGYPFQNACPSKTLFVRAGFTFPLDSSDGKVCPLSCPERPNTNTTPHPIYYSPLY